MTTRRWAALAAVVVIAIAGVVLVLVPRGGAGAQASPAGSTSPSTSVASTTAGPATSSGPAPDPAAGFPSPSPVATVAPAVPFTAADGDRIATDLSSTALSSQAEALVPEVRDAFLAAAVSAIPDGSTVTVLADHFIAIQPDYGSVPIVVTGASNGQFVAALLYEDGQWLIATTEEVQ